MNQARAMDMAGALERLFEHGRQRHYAAGATIVSAGDHSDELFYIVEGSVSVIYEDELGHELILAYLNEGEFFGEIGMFDERHERSAWVSARSAVVTSSVSYDQLREISAEDPSFVLSLLSGMAFRLRRTNEKAGDLAFLDTAGRVARALIRLRDEPDVDRERSGVRVRITRQELGRLAGCSREMVSRVLKSLEQRGVIALSGRDIVILNQ
jgi:CRP/FNR family cyclic AMP-dependent transcriptional regulator